MAVTRKSLEIAVETGNRTQNGTRVRTELERHTSGNQATYHVVERPWVRPLSMHSTINGRTLSEHEEATLRSWQEQPARAQPWHGVAAVVVHQTSSSERVSGRNRDHGKERVTGQSSYYGRESENEENSDHGKNRVSEQKSDREGQYSPGETGESTRENTAVD